MIVLATRLRQRITAVLAVACVLLQALATAFHAPALAGLGASSVNGPLQAIVICSAHGIRTITVDAEGNPVEAPAPVDTRLSCQMCLVLGGTALAPPASGAVIAVAVTSARMAPPAHDGAPRGMSVRSHQIRGPPASAAT